MPTVTGGLAHGLFRAMHSASRRPGGSVRRRYLTMLPGALALVCAGCGSQAQAPARIAQFVPSTRPVIVPNPSGVPDAFFRPNPIRVRAGQFITWTNRDTDPHDVTAYSGAFASGAIAAGGTWRWVIARPGRYRYFCTLHPEMHGTIIVHP
ncbi:MAG: hypothetical protein NVSMB22_16560 [Chloroflexota bacterium]